MRFKAILVAILVMLNSAVFSQDFCGYSNTNQLAWDKRFPMRIHQFLGDKKVKFFYDGELYKQVLDGLGGPPDEIDNIGGNQRFSSACRAHSCEEKAAVIFTCPGEVLAVGILHFDIRTGHFDSRAETLTIYSDKLTPAMHNAFDAWKKEIEQSSDITVTQDLRMLNGE